MNRKLLPIVLILLLAFAVRVVQLPNVPPGLTHDEANHARNSLTILDGTLLIFSPLNYGLEPLYDYLVAGVMGLAGGNILTTRLVSVLSGLLTVAVAFAWTRRAFDRRTALIAAALLAVSFWPIATSRQALRSSLLPLLTAAAVIFFWQVIWGKRRWVWPALGFGLMVAASIYTYLAARVTWLLFPLFILYLVAAHRERFRRAWLVPLPALAMAGLLAMPLFAYIRANPQAAARLNMLDQPLQQLQAGQFGPILRNSVDSLLAFFWPGAGDQFLAYNIPGRPVFLAISALFFGLGLAVCLWRWRRPAHALLLGWFALGIVPSLVTGATAGTTRNIVALPATYILAGVGFANAAAWWRHRRWRRVEPAISLLLAVWLVVVAVDSLGDYFWRWSDSPDVRAAYQHTLIEGLAALENYPPAPAVISTVYPGPAHDPSIAKMLFPAEADNLRWVDARWGLLLPAGQGGRLVAPSSTPLHPAFADLVRLQARFEVRPDDLDPTFTIYDLQAGDWPLKAGLANFGDALTLLEARWLGDGVRPGETAELLTAWRVVDPDRVGPRVPPLDETDVTLFAHVLDQTGGIVSQWDALDAPSWSWVKGDVFFQVHPLFVPAESAPATYQVVVGVYDRSSGQRLGLVDETGASGDAWPVAVPLDVHDG